jgi:hypothetical protein
MAASWVAALLSVSALDSSTATRADKLNTHPLKGTTMLNTMATTTVEEKVATFLSVTTFRGSSTSGIDASSLVFDFTHGTLSG